ncbi:DUF7739 domain-containing protein [Streptomyces sp. SAS_275]|uniref:DUF7739 domain-containing protein n=1 Tax=Streptomyces sp. SAS_275 TaxID=3412746 RepID=UPI00403D2420
MGISISHGVQNTRSATTIANLGKHLAHALSSSDWREVSPLFDGTVRTPVTVLPADAGHIGAILNSAASRRAMDPEWGQLAAEFGNAAMRAARAGQNCEWD